MRDKLFTVGLLFLLIIIFCEFTAIILLNHGFFTYTLDDPYIHMALAENILHGHYGINNKEYSSPSSSILWPFIIAPFSSYEYSPFFINIFAAILTCYLFAKILLLCRGRQEYINNTELSVYLILLIISTNIIGVIFTGMEHSLQILLVTAISYGLIIESETSRIASWFPVVIAIAPLIRYENISISIATIIYLYIQRYFKMVYLVSIITAIIMISFSLFLDSLNLPLLPVSVIAKSLDGGTLLHSVLVKIKENLTNHHGLILILGILFLLSYCLLTKKECYIKNKKISIITICAIILHFVIGKYGWYHRYELYIWTFFILMFINVYKQNIKDSFLERRSDKKKIIFLSIFFVLIINYDYVFQIITIPLASNNIYEQQYQMHRFAVTYNKNVAVNDLGYVSYKNENHILDLWGLGSYDAFRYRHGKNGDWMKFISDKHDVKLAMIYEQWFQDIPHEWKKIGVLQLSRRNITPADSKVAFYATNNAYISDIKNKIRMFSETLPLGVKFVIL